MLIVLIALLFVVELIAYFSSIGLDYYGKYKNKKIIRNKMNRFFVRSKYEQDYKISAEGRPLSLISLIFQIINLCLVLMYIIIAILFIVTNDQIYLAIDLLASIILGGGYLISGTVVVIQLPYRWR